MINKTQMSKVKSQKFKLKAFKFALIIATLNFALYTLNSNVLAATPTPKPITSSPTASPSAIPEEEKVQEIRQAIKEKVNEIKEKIEKKAYVGKIIEVTDSVIVLNNFRGKQRVRITDESKIIENKKEIKTKELAVDDKIIAMGTISDNDILEAKRVVVVPLPKNQPPKKLVFWGLISSTDIKNSSLTLSGLDKISGPVIKTDKTTKIFSVDQKTELKFKDLKENQKIVIVYLEASAGKTPLSKTIFLLP